MPLLIFKITAYMNGYFDIVLFIKTVKFVYNDHHLDPWFVAIVDRWSLFRGDFVTKIGDFKMIKLAGFCLVRFDYKIF